MRSNRYREVGAVGELDRSDAFFGDALDALAPLFVTLQTEEGAILGRGKGRKWGAKGEHAGHITDS